MRAPVGYQRQQTEAVARAQRRLLIAGAVFAAAVIVHNADHIRRGADAITRDVFWLGVPAVLVEVGLVVVIFQRNWVAPLAALVYGPFLAAGYVEVHFLPRHGFLSDSFTSAVHVSPLSWFAASFEIVGALAIAVCGWRLLRSQGGLHSLAAANRPASAFQASRIHPITVVTVISQAAVLVISFIQL
jgi:hypothetical protein